MAAAIQPTIAATTNTGNAPEVRRNATSLYSNIPEQLKSRPQWVCWGVSKSNPKAPYNPASLEPAKAGKPETWGSYEQACQRVQQGKADGIGFEFHSNGLIGIDLDTVRDPETGAVDPLAHSIIESMGSYTEISPSGYGFHIIVEGDALLHWHKARLPENGIRRPDLDAETGLQRIDKRNGKPIFKTPEIEMYNGGRYFTITGSIVGEHREITRRPTQLAALVARFAKKERGPVKKESSPAKKDYLQTGLQKDPKFRDYWEGNRPIGNESADDLGLMSKLAYWCNGDPDAMISAFLSSPHMATKDEKHRKKAAQRKDYLQRTAQSAIMSSTTTAAQDDEAFQSRRMPKQPKPRTQLKQSLAFMEVYTPTEIVPALLDFDLNDSGNAQRFLYFHKEEVRYSRENACWYIWDGRRWEQDLNGKIFRMAIRTAKIYRNTAAKRYEELKQEWTAFQLGPAAYINAHQGREPDDPKQFRSVNTHSVTSGNMARLHGMVENAQTAYIAQDSLDKPKHLLTCGNGTLDLQTGQLLAHDPDHFITRLVDLDYDPAAPAPVFQSFLERIFDGDRELIDYVQKVMGYCATGETREQCFFIGWGTGANGKSTLMDAVTAVLDQYSQTIPTHVLMDRERDSGPTPELARAKAARLVIASESKDINSLNENQIKQLTGGDTVSVRPLYSQGFEFKPAFKIWLLTNHKPTIKGLDNGIWRRVHLIPFAVTIPDQEQDPGLPEKLRRERAGILAWLVEGARKYYAEGLQKPLVVRMATDEYRSEMDQLGSFLGDCVEQKEGAFIRSSDLFLAYCGWCQYNGIEQMKQNAFGRKLTERNMKASRTAIARGYLGYSFTEIGSSCLHNNDSNSLQIIRDIS